MSWNDDDYSRLTHPTTDPDVRVVLTRDDYSDSPDTWDCEPPRLTGSGWGVRDFQSDDDSVSDAALAACHHYGELPWQLDEPDSLAARYLRVWHGVKAIHVVTSTLDRYASVVVFDTLPWREAMGIDSTLTLTRADIASDWQAWLDGDVWRIGYETRELTACPGIDDEPDTWDYTPVCGGFYGEAYARASALADYACELPPGVAPLYRRGGAA